jgi:hypothetical protein
MLWIVGDKIPYRAEVSFDSLIPFFRRMRGEKKKTISFSLPLGGDEQSVWIGGDDGIVEILADYFQSGPCLPAGKAFILTLIPEF